MNWTIELIKQPNQAFYTNVNGHKVDVRLRTYRGYVYADFKIDDSYVACGVRCIPGVGLLPGSAVDLLGGNFSFETKNDIYPQYSDFDGVTCVFGFTGA